MPSTPLPGPVRGLGLPRVPAGGAGVDARLLPTDGEACLGRPPLQDRRGSRRGAFLHSVEPADADHVAETPGCDPTAVFQRGAHPDPGTTLFSGVVSFTAVT